VEELGLLMRDGAGKRIVIVGDASSSVNQSVESQLRSMYENQVERLQGAEIRPDRPDRGRGRVEGDR
jgi:hypothetical protein